MKKRVKNGMTMRCSRQIYILRHLDSDTFMK